MRPDARLDVIEADTSIQAAAAFMRSRGLHEVLVVEHGELVGRLSERTIIFGALTTDRHPATVTAREWCEPRRPR